MQRQATHADSWYSGDPRTLNRQLEGWLEAVQPSGEFSPPIKGSKAIIGPHAGYSYSGPNAAWAYKSIDTTGIKRVFILGPSHHVYIRTCALSACQSYATPLGELPLDKETIDELEKTGKFEVMSRSTDEDEHSIELHLPYVRKIFEEMDIKIVPILVGAVTTQDEAAFGALLAPYLTRDDTFTVVSSDFCHWGKRFSYTFYYPSPPPCEGLKLSKSTPRSTMASLPSFPIHKSITALDQEAIDILTIPTGDKPAAEVHVEFANYLTRTKNTICGRHPIGVLLGALAVIDENAPGGGMGRSVKMQWVKYDHSSECETLEDSSVSYASAYVLF
ncbi:hypothetical protein FRC14_005592 [Serendipita sp. 396]|nr:hypothetical protein FRC14_005592 [Serendipita sp. 396]KAG8787284.1 hypothetical protein FRC15_009587 [Serendipita sp. 397]KAG8875471.1 hypothetical protein FRC20_003885 [Serendipita sp. 405]KAG9058331.1 hypothetical protein FS842_010057 [Serendipita sp. 407]